MSDLPIMEGVGYGAAGLVLATFCMRSMRALRWVAIASNLAFIAYGYLGGLAPVLLLHALLLPVNICRLAQLRGARIRSDPSETPEKSGRSSRRHPFSRNSGRRAPAITGHGRRQGADRNLSSPPTATAIDTTACTRGL